jgi:hypothetical protein
VHELTDPVCGSAVCGDCYDWDGAVLFNARAGELWRRTIIAVARQLAAASGVPARRFAGQHRLEFAKVVEFQARGVVHLHVLARLDQLSPTAVTVDGAGLCAAFVAAAARTVAPNPLRPDKPIRWGAQVDVEVIPASRRRAALGARADLAVLNLRAWAHSLGFRGHWLTKSRHWSTTFAQLRAARQAWRVEQLGITAEDLEGRWGEWDYRGTGYSTAGDAWLAASANTARRANRRAARDAQ